MDLFCMKLVRCNRVYGTKTPHMCCHRTTIFQQPLKHKRRGLVRPPNQRTRTRHTKRLRTEHSNPTMCRPREIRTIAAEQLAANRNPAQKPVGKDSDFTCGLEEVLPMAWDVETWRKSVDNSFWKVEDGDVPTTIIDAEELCADIDSCLNSATETPEEYQAHSPSTQSSDDDKSFYSKSLHADFKKVASIGKWRRRDIAKHLAGERNRRAKRMGKVQTLRNMLPGMSTSKPTVNQILQKAIEVVQQDKGRQRERQEASSFYRDLMRSSTTVATLVLDGSMCVVDSSEGLRSMLHWPGDEESMRGEHLSAIIHPEDAYAVSRLVEHNRIIPHPVALRSSAVFSSFCSVNCQSNEMAFATGYLPRCPLSISVCGPITTILVEQ